MGVSKIEWTERVWNPTRGCERISPGCANCYAERDYARKNSNPKVPGCQGFAIFNDRHESHWTGRVELIESMLEEPLHRKHPTMYFVDSVSDLFHDSLPDEAIDRVFAVMALCPQHTFQCLSKRSARMLKYMQDCRGHRVAIRDEPEGNLCNLPSPDVAARLTWPLPNVWLGVSVENQHYADERIPHLLRTPAAVRFVSYEPALGPVNFEPWLCQCSQCFRLKRPNACRNEALDWIIVGGESGPARARSISRGRGRRSRSAMRQVCRCS